jgi:hypothetical protein
MKTGKEHLFAHDLGRRLAFLRPAKPEVSLALGRKAMETNDGSLLEQLPEEAGPYTFVGWVSADGKQALDDEGEVVGKPEAGDSIVTLKDDGDRS